MTSKANMEVWNSLCETDPQFTKPFNRGNFSGTDINPMWRWRRLTELFGPAGSGWGVETHTANMIDLPEGEKMICISVTGFYIKDGQKHLTPPGFGQDYVVRMTQRNGLRSDDEASKKAFTDALGNAFKYLGLGADVFMRMHDDSKYVNDLRNKFSEQDQNDPQPEKPAETKEPAEEYDPAFPDVPEGREHLAKLKDGIPLFVHQDTDEGNTDVANLAAWYIENATDLRALLKISQMNLSILDGLKTDNGMNPIEQGACDWTTKKLSNTKTERGLNLAWKKIAAEVNEVKESLPPVYTGITNAFKERKKEVNA